MLLAGNEVLLWQIGYGSLIRNDFYNLMRLDPTTKGYLLEAGCGIGGDTRNWQSIAPGLEIVGIDLSANSVAWAANRNPQAAFAVANVEAIPFPAATFDYLTSHEVLEHTQTPERALAEFYRVLRPGGIAVLATPNGASLWLEHLKQRLVRLFGGRGAPVGADHTRPASFWKRELKRAGFVIDATIYDGVAIDFQTYMAPPFVMRLFGRWLEPLRIVPGIRTLLADRVKFRVVKLNA